MDGTPDGKIKCTIGNWIGVVYKDTQSKNLILVEKEKN